MTPGQPNILASVGMGGQNRPADVVTVQMLINRAGVNPVPMSIAPSGVCDMVTIGAIRHFQRTAMRQPMAIGLIRPGDATFAALVAEADRRSPPLAAPIRRSGADWWHANQANYPNSESVDDLAPAFRADVQRFIAALRAGRARISIGSTRRNANRAWLMHYSWRIAHGDIDPADVPDRDGVPIVWTHPTLAEARRAARQMVDLFDIAFRPSLTSMHIAGLAIDMTITWSGTMTIVDAGGVTREIGSPNNGADNAHLHRVGRGFGVIKLLRDPPHWSSNGR